MVEVTIIVTTIVIACNNSVGSDHDNNGNMNSYIELYVKYKRNIIRTTFVPLLSLKGDVTYNITVGFGIKYN
jgi:hypothetical protein